VEARSWTNDTWNSSRELCLFVWERLKDFWVVYLRKRDWTIAAASAWTMSERRLEVEGQVVSFRRGRGVFVEVEVEEDWAEGGVGENVSIMTIVVVVGVGVERLERGIECAYLCKLVKKIF